MYLYLLAIYGYMNNFMLSNMIKTFELFGKDYRYKWINVLNVFEIWPKRIEEMLSKDAIMFWAPTKSAPQALFDHVCANVLCITIIPSYIIHMLYIFTMHSKNTYKYTSQIYYSKWRHSKTKRNMKRNMHRSYKEDV